MAKKVNLSPTRPRSSAARPRAKAGAPGEPSHPEAIVPSGLPARENPAPSKNLSAPPPTPTAASIRIDKAFKELVDAVGGHGAMFVICTCADTGAMSVAVAKNHIRLNASLLADAACRFRDERKEDEPVSLGAAIYSSIILALAEMATSPNPQYRQQIHSIHQDLSRAYVNVAKEKGLDLNERGEVIDKNEEAQGQENTEQCKK